MKEGYLAHTCLVQVLMGLILIVNKAKIDVFLELSGISKWVKSHLWVDGRRESHSSDQEVEMSTGWGGYFILF